MNFSMIHLKVKLVLTLNSVSLSLIPSRQKSSGLDEQTSLSIQKKLWSQELHFLRCILNSKAVENVMNSSSAS